MKEKVIIKNEVKGVLVYYTKIFMTFFKIKPWTLI